MTTANRARPAAPRPPAASDGQPAAGPAAPPEPDVAAWIASASLTDIKAAWRAVSAPFAYRDLLPAPVLAGLRELNDKLSERLCPYTTAELDATRDELNQKYPGYEHSYIRSGTAVWWCDRRKDKPSA